MSYKEELSASLDKATNSIHVAEVIFNKVARSKAMPVKKEKAQLKTGRVNVYVIHSPDFFARLRPSYDSSADAVGELTEREASTLRAMIHRYIAKCHARHGCKNLDLTKHPS